MADALADLGSFVNDRILVLNIIHGLNQRFEHLGAIIRRSSPFPKFLKVHYDLLEEIHLGRPQLLRRSTPALRLRLLSRSLPCHLDRPTATTTGTRTTTAAMAAMVVATAARTVAAVAAMVVTLATPPRPPLDPPATTAGPLLHGRRMSIRGRGTSPCTLARYLRDSSISRPSWSC
jgi:hypothetical protein